MLTLAGAGVASKAIRILVPFAIAGADGLDILAECCTTMARHITKRRTDMTNDVNDDRVRMIIDRDSCIGAGQCEMHDDSVFELDDDVLVTVIGDGTLLVRLRGRRSRPMPRSGDLVRRSRRSLILEARQRLDRRDQ